MIAIVSFIALVFMVIAYGLNDMRYMVVSVPLTCGVVVGSLIFLCTYYEDMKWLDRPRSIGFELGLVREPNNRPSLIV